MPRRWATATTVFGPTSAQSRTATVLSESASAVAESVTGPRYSFEKSSGRHPATLTGASLRMLSGVSPFSSADR